MSVTRPKGFRAAGVAAGIKQDSLDLALIENDGPMHTAAGVFTTNAIKAAPVLWSQQVLKQGQVHAVVLNSGGANACTGPEGFQDTHATAEKVAEVLGKGASEIAVCSTGLIGERLPMHAVLSGVDTAAESLASTDDADQAAATAVLTTDSVPKQAWEATEQGWSIGGFAKGAGMLAPALAGPHATMLAVLTTDAIVFPEDLQPALEEAVRLTFNRLDVDGGTSTNDTVLLLCSGASETEPTREEFTAQLTRVCAGLTQQLRADAEGATKYVDVVVTGAHNEAEAEQAARVIAEDSLVKTALFGSDPNWGRIAMAVGRSGAQMDASLVDISVNGTLLYSAASPQSAQPRESVDLSGRDIEIHIGLHQGEGQARVLTTDLSHAYVEENSAYSS